MPHDQTNHYRIYTLSGQPVIYIQVQGNIRMDIGWLPSGVYVVSDGRHEAVKFIK